MSLYRTWRVTRRLGLKRALRLSGALAGALLLQRAVPAPPAAAQSDPAPGGSMSAGAAGASFRLTMTSLGADVGTINGQLSLAGDVSLDGTGPGGRRTRLALVGTQLYFTFAEQWRMLDASSVCRLPLVTDTPVASGPASIALARPEWLRRLFSDPLAAFGGMERFNETSSSTASGVPTTTYRGSTDAARLISALGVMLNIDDACARVVLDLAMDMADLGPLQLGAILVEITLGVENRFPYELRFTLRDDRGRDLQGAATLTPIGEPPSIAAPSGAQPAL